MSFKSLLHKLFYLLVLLSLLTGCYEEYIEVPNYAYNAFEFKMTPEWEQKLHESVGEKYLIEPVPDAYYGGYKLSLDKIGVRGQSSANYPRKSLAVNMDGVIAIPNKDSTGFNYYEKFKLLAMAADYTYIENRLSHHMLSELGLWPLHTFFTEVWINSNHQGLYMFVQEPEEYFLETEGYDFILRRHYQGNISGFELNSRIDAGSADAYINSFKRIYELITQYTGKQLFDTLNHLLNVDSYMRVMALNTIIENGDCTDEFYFFAKRYDNGEIRFDVMPWDFDDIFGYQPHEISRAWAVGTLFGERVYDTWPQLLEDQQGRLVYTTEDDLDYIIVHDDYLYARYLENLEWVLSKYDQKYFEDLFQVLYDELTPFYAIDAVIENSKLDDTQTSMYNLERNIESKKTFLIDQIARYSDSLLILNP